MRTNKLVVTRRTSKCETVCCATAGLLQLIKPDESSVTILRPKLEKDSFQKSQSRGRRVLTRKFLVRTRYGEVLSRLTLRSLWRFPICGKERSSVEINKTSAPTCKPLVTCCNSRGCLNTSVSGAFEI